MTQASSGILDAPVHTPHSIAVFREVESLVAAIDMKVRRDGGLDDDAIRQIVMDRTISTETGAADILMRFARERIERWKEARTALCGVVGFRLVFDQLLDRRDIDESVRRCRFDQLVRDMTAFAIAHIDEREDAPGYVCTLTDGSIVRLEPAPARQVQLRLFDRKGQRVYSKYIQL